MRRPSLARAFLYCLLLLAFARSAAAQGFHVQSVVVGGSYTLEVTVPEYKLELFHFAGIFRTAESMPFPVRLAKIQGHDPVLFAAPATYHLTLSEALESDQTHILVLVGPGGKPDAPNFLKLQFKVTAATATSPTAASTTPAGAPLAVSSVSGLELLPDPEAERLPSDPSVFCYSEYWQGWIPCFEKISVDVSGTRTRHGFNRGSAQDSDINESSDFLHVAFETEVQFRMIPTLQLKDASYAWLTRFRFRLDRSRTLSFLNKAAQEPDISPVADLMRVDSDFTFGFKPLGTRRQLADKDGKSRWLTFGAYIGLGLESKFFNSTRKLRPGEDPSLNVTTEKEVSLPRPFILDPQVGLKLQGSVPNHFAKVGYSFGSNLRSYRIDPNTLAVSTVARPQRSMLWGLEYDRKLGESDWKWDVSLEGRFNLPRDDDQLGETRFKNRIRTGFEFPLTHYKLLKCEPYVELLLFRAKIPNDTLIAPDLQPRGLFRTLSGGVQFNLQK